MQNRQLKLFSIFSVKTNYKFTIPSETKEGDVKMEDSKKQVTINESMIVNAILSYFLKEKLLTEQEFATIKNTLRTRDITVDISVGKCDVCK